MRGRVCKWQSRGSMSFLTLFIWISFFIKLACKMNLLGYSIVCFIYSHVLGSVVHQWLELQLVVQIDNNDPNASLTHKRVDAIQKTCISSGLLSKRFVIFSISLLRWSLYMLSGLHRLSCYRSLHVYESKFHYVTLLVSLMPSTRLIIV